jgi:hypothetical protein
MGTKQTLRLLTKFTKPTLKMKPHILQKKSLQDNQIPKICVQSLLRQPASFSSDHFNDPFHKKDGSWRMLGIVVSI